MPSEVLIRPRTDDDVPRLVEVLTAQRPLTRYPMRWPLPFPVADFIVRAVDLAAWTAELDGRPVGHVAAQHADDELLAPYWEAGHGLPRDRLGVLGTLFVDPSVRRQGIARRLHDTCVDWLRAHDRQPCLDVAPVHAVAHEMYPRLGWREVARLRPPWLPDGEPDVLAMVLPPS